MNEIEAEVIIALAENGLRIERAASILYMHRSTVSRHIRNIKRKTGKDPLDFYDMWWLTAKAKMIAGKYGNFYDDEQGVKND